MVYSSQLPNFSDGPGQQSSARAMGEDEWIEYLLARTGGCVRR